MIRRYLNRGLMIGVLLTTSGHSQSATPPIVQLPAPDPATVSTELLPEDTHRKLVIRTCLTCHPVELVTAKKNTPEKWDDILARMKDHGAVATEDELDQIFAYLVKHLNSESARTP